MSETDSVAFGATRIDYSIQRTSRRKTIAITVTPELAVAVAVPKGTRRVHVARRVYQKAEWIIQQQERFRRNGRHYPRDWVSGESLRYLGRQYQLKIVRLATVNGNVRATMARGYLFVRVSRRWSADHRRGAIRAALVRWYRHHAGLQIRSAVDQFAPRLGVAVSSAEIREMKTRWGSGGADGRVRFNWRIVMAPKRLLEYVVAHELCHIRHHDHSREFWRLLSQVMPDYAERRQELERIGRYLEMH